MFQLKPQIKQAVNTKQKMNMISVFSLTNYQFTIKSDDC